jgi:hypothetical protein
MKWISKAELKLLKHISKLEGQLASAHYALELMRNEEILPPRNTRRTIQTGGFAAIQEQSKSIPLFS